MKHRIVVLGAGYVGATTAGRLAKRLHRDDVEITLVGADPDFVERVRMHQLAAGQDLPQRPLRELFAGSGVRVRTALVTAVDVDRKTVALADAEPLRYDTLVYALGSTAASEVPGVLGHAYTLSGKPDALRLRTRLETLAAGSSVGIVGGGLTAIEAATEIAESRPDLTVTILARGGVGDWLHDRARQHLRAVFDRLGITVCEDAEVTRVTERGVTLADTSEFATDVTVWTAGFAVHPIAAATPLTVSDTGRVVVDRTMRSVSHPDVYAAGDAALAPGPDGRPLRMSCAAGTPMAWRAADAIAARLTGRAAPEAAIGYALQCVSLGRRDAVIQRVTFDDQPTSTVLTGRLGARVKELICAGAAWGVGHPTVLLPSRRRRVATGPTGDVANRSTYAEPSTGAR
ncbi:NAD(P)/FAD-dependent oxidoreductase [Nocardia rhizosphaerae]|uniref:NAD(P)/FAD-dependent oxidoreductase n=1 Tax=Nocardia rhizosphaerae TaxID=1691571 RepID=A0ABV8L1F4_9NOCA